MLSAGNRRPIDIKHRHFERHTSTESEAFSLFRNMPGQTLSNFVRIHCYRDDLRYNLGKTTVQEGKKSSSVDLVDLRYSKNTNTAFGYDNMMQVFFKKIDVPFG